MRLPRFVSRRCDRESCAAARQPGRLRVLLGLLFTLFAAPLAGAESGAPAPRAWYPVWSAVLAHGLTPEVAHVLIVNRTVTAPWSRIGDDQDAEDASAPRAPYYLPAPIPEQGALAFAIGEGLELDRHYTLMDSKTLKSVFRPGPDAGWQEFFQRFADVPGIIGMSAVRFTDDGEQASVYLAFGCGPDCGTGRVLYLERDRAAAWQVVGSDLVWLAGG